MGKVIASIAGMALMVVGAYTGNYYLMAAGMAINSANQLLAKKPKIDSYRDQSERKQMLRSAVAPESVILGKTVISGLLMFAEEEAGEQDDGEWIHLAIVLAGHPIDRVGRIWLGDELITTFDDFATWELHNDRSTCDPFMLKNCPSWKEDMVGKGIAWLRVSLKFNVDKFPYGLPNIKAEVWGKKLYDPRTGVTEWSNNLALGVLDYYRSVLQVPDAEINWAQFKQAANICAEQVTTPAGEYEARYTLNGSFDLSETPAALLESMHLCCAGEPTYIAGQHGILVGAYYGPALLTLNEHQMADTVQITTETALRDATNTVYGTFVDEEQLATKTDFPPVRVMDWITEDGLEIKDDVDLRFVSTPYQAQRVANILLRRKRAGRMMVVKTNLSGYGYRPGMVIKLDMPSLGVQGAEFRITGWRFSMTGGAELTLQEEQAEFYNDAIGQPFIRPPFTQLPTGGPTSPVGLQLLNETVGDIVQGVLAWTNIGSIAYNNITVFDGAGQAVFTAQVPGTRIQLTGLPSGRYAAQVRAVSTVGMQSAPAAIAFTIQSPPVPVSVEVTAGNWSLLLVPRFNGTTAIGTQCEFWYYTADLPLDQVTTTAKFVGTGSSMSHQGLAANTSYYYWVRGINSYGVSAFLRVEAKTTYDPSEIIELLDGEIGAEQLRDELRKPLEETIEMWTAKVGNDHIAGGIGLTIEKDPDGRERIKCIVDADLFAIVNRHGNTNINPFVVKDGTAYINHLMVDNAEIGSVIAKYINVQHLVGTLIEGSTINGGNITGTNIYGANISGTTINASNINGGNINIANLFRVDGNGNIIMQATPDTVGLKITNQTISVYRGDGLRAVAIGLIG
ncbi:phage tail tip fiber protein [Yersinia ruckeri]|uniref:phage tail tip protein J-related protein n=1 Tax=Yersinia ruckeri TaxID=29486 RepID=UPI0022382D6B|nr:DUF1983 domain-containing protein [Yersinia ruckeri]MCW6563909.1 DUF1983 domain-containing protein [Yersinia ruckeri]MCW6573585.1 DUF1983 domain-containing protein [Yersinia ruckeri]MCW6613693.1 DUF1983 domain-containing protein [Yersinia ruckeri]UZX67207.1 DUF1983 domain-containing protein [Yersinia ruckeri]